MTGVARNLWKWEGMVAGGAAALMVLVGCENGNDVEYLSIEPSSVENDAYVVDLGEIPAGAPWMYGVEFWNIAEEAWTMDLSTTAGDEAAVSIRCDQEYDCGYVGPLAHSEWTFEIIPGAPGSQGEVRGIVALNDADTADFLTSSALVVRWSVCSPSQVGCGDSEL